MFGNFLTLTDLAKYFSASLDTNLNLSPMNDILNFYIPCCNRFDRKQNKFNSGVYQVCHPFSARLKQAKAIFTVHEKPGACHCPTKAEL